MAVKDLELRRVKSDLMFGLSPRSSGTFTVDSLSVPKSDLHKWNICDIIKSSNDQRVKKLKCTNLTVGFGVLEQLDAFEKRFNYVFLEWAIAAQQRLAVMLGIDRGRIPVGSFPVSPSSWSVPRIPAINIPDISGQAWRELEDEMHLRELDAERDSLPSIAEIGDTAG